jgi:hypothetical protein
MICIFAQIQLAEQPRLVCAKFAEQAGAQDDTFIGRYPSYSMLDQPTGRRLVIAWRARCVQARMGLTSTPGKCWGAWQLRNIDFLI